MFFSSFRMPFLRHMYKSAHAQQPPCATGSMRSGVRYEKKGKRKKNRSQAEQEPRAFLLPIQHSCRGVSVSLGVSSLLFAGGLTHLHTHTLMFLLPHSAHPFLCWQRSALLSCCFFVVVAVHMRRSTVTRGCEASPPPSPQISGSATSSVLAGMGSWKQIEKKSRSLAEGRSKVLMAAWLWV